MNVEKETGLKLNIQKTKILESGPITSQQIRGNKVETVIDFIFLGSKITEDGDCRYEFKRHLLLRRKVVRDKPRKGIKEQRHHFADKGSYSQSYDFSSSHIWM